MRSLRAINDHNDYLLIHPIRAIPPEAALRPGGGGGATGGWAYARCA